MNYMENNISDNQIRHHPYQDFTNIQEIDVDILYMASPILQIK